MNNSETLPLFAIHMRAKNDSNGNPRRVFVGYNEFGHTTHVTDEGYLGQPAWIRAMNAAGVWETSMEVTIAQYNRMMKQERAMRKAAKTA